MITPLDCEGMLKLGCSLDTGGLESILQGIHSDIRQTTTMLHTLHEEFYQLRKQQEEFRIKLKGRLSKSDAQRALFEQELQGLRDAIDALPKTFVEKELYTPKMAGVHQQLIQATQRIADIEASEGRQMKEYVNESLQKVLEEWYEPRAAEVREHLSSEIAYVKVLCETNFKADLQKTTDTFTSRLYGVADRAHEEVKEVQSEKDRQILVVTRMQEAEKSEMRELLDQQNKDIRKVLFDADTRHVNRFVIDEEKVTSLFHVMCIDESDILEIYRNRETFDIAGRVTAMHNSEPFVELRSRIQQDIRLRISQAKEEDQDDLSKHLIELQRELRTKPSLQRVLELIQENLDTELYENVDSVQYRVSELEVKKVGTDVFAEALKSKTDSKITDQKADRAFVNSLFEFLRAKVEQFAENQSSDISRIVDATLRNQLVEGGRTRERSSTIFEGIDPNRWSEQLMIGQDDPASHANRKPLSFEDKTKIDNALNPVPEYSWGATNGKRVGMPPNRNLRGGAGGVAVPYRFDKEQDTRKMHGDPTRSRPQTGRNQQNEEVSRWADVAASGNEAPHDEKLPPLQQQQQQLQQQQQQPQTRSHEAYMKAVQSASQSLSHAIETSPMDTYVSESERRKVPHPPLR